MTKVRVGSRNRKGSLCHGYNTDVGVCRDTGTGGIGQQMSSLLQQLFSYFRLENGVISGSS